MSQFFIGQIMMTGFPFPQKFFAQCNGQTMGIQQNQALFALLGVRYGGDGATTFNLPNLQGRTPVGAGQSVDGGWNPPPYPQGMIAGVESVTIDMASMPTHNHMINVTTAAGTATLPSSPSLYATATLSDGTNESIYVPQAAGQTVPLMATTVTPTGSSQPHPNMQPYQVINFNIALSGIWPSRN